MVQKNKTRKNIKRKNIKNGGAISGPLITIPLTVAGIIGVIYFLKKTILEIKNDVKGDINEMKSDIIKDVKTVVDHEVAVLDAKIPNIMKNKQNLREIEELEKRIDDIYNVISNKIEPEDNFDLDRRKNACKNTSDIPKCLRKLLVDVQRLDSKYRYRINENNIYKTKELKMDLNSDDDSEVKAAKIAALHHNIQQSKLPKKRTLKSKIFSKGQKKSSRRKPKKNRKRSNSNK